MLKELSELSFNKKKIITFSYVSNKDGLSQGI